MRSIILAAGFFIAICLTSAVWHIYYAELRQENKRLKGERRLMDNEMCSLKGEVHDCNKEKRDRINIRIPRSRPSYEETKIMGIEYEDGKEE